MKVLALPEVRQYLNGLIKILYAKNYFSFPDSAEKYVTDLFDDIKTLLFLINPSISDISQSWP